MCYCGSNHHAHTFAVMMSVMTSNNKREGPQCGETQENLEAYLFIDSGFNKGRSWQDGKQLKQYRLTKCTREKLQL